MKNNRLSTGSTFLVLTDFSETSNQALKYSMKLAKLIEGKIHLFHISSPLKTVTTDNQAAAMREIQTDNRECQKQLRAVKEMIAAEGIEVTTSHTTGNVNGEIQREIDRVNPNLVVAGKRKRNFGGIGKTTRFLIHKYSGPLLIVGKESNFERDTKISLTSNGKAVSNSDLDVVFDLTKHTDIPLTLLNVTGHFHGYEKSPLAKSWRASTEEPINIKFEHHQDASFVNGLLDHVSKKKTELLCVGRNLYGNSAIHRLINGDSTIAQIVRKVDVPILITAG